MAKGRTMDMGMVMSWAVGVASIALLLLIMLILFGNLSGNVGFGDDSKTITVTNETNAWLNITGYTLSVVNSSTSGYTLTTIFSNSENQSLTYNFTIPLANATVTSLGVVSNATEVFNATVYNNVSLTYTYAYATPSIGKANTDNFIANYTQSVLNVGKQLPTVGTIIGVALLLFILIALLVFALRSMAGVSRSGSGGNFG